MSTINFNLRGIEPKVMALLKKEAAKQQTSINAVILNCIEQNMGYCHKISNPTYDDLDYLAGTWKTEDAKAFNKNIAFFEKTDKDLS